MPFSPPALDLLEKKNLKIMACQLLAGCVSGYLVSPLNTVVDKAVVEYASGKASLWKGATQSLRRLVFTPKIFLTSFEFKWMFLVYGLTYSSSNFADHVHLTDSISQQIQKLLIVFAVNTTSSLIKDRAYIRHFGVTQPRPFPVSALGFLFTRDIIAMASAFTLPDILAKKLTQQMGTSEKRAGTIAQLSCPLLVQFVATPIHLMGLDLYNNPENSLKDRIIRIKRLYFNSMVIRMARFLPAYGLGGVFNKQFRNYLKKDC